MRPHAAALPLAKARSSAIDAGRFLASAGVVFLHSAQSQQSVPYMLVGQFGVPFYLFVALLLQGQSFGSDQSPSPARYAAGRARRLYLPFLFWCAIYAIARSVKRVVIDGDGFIDLSLRTLWSGTQYHLWFLPFLLVLSTLTAGVHAKLARSTDRARQSNLAAIGFAIAGLLFCIANVPVEWSADFRDPNYAFFQAWRSLPAACWAMALSILATSSRSPRASRTLQLPIWFAACAIAGLVLVVWSQSGGGGLSAATRGLCGLLCAVFVLAPWRGRIVERLGRLGRCSFGIYLTHVLIVELLHALLSGLKIRATPSIDLATFALAMIGSVTITLVLARHRRLAWVVGR